MTDTGRGLGLWVDRLRIAVWAVVVILVVAPRLVGFSSDSDAYLDVAANLLAGRGIVQTVVDFWRPGIPDPLGMWPPLFPMVVAALATLGFSLTTAARLVAALGYVAFALAFHRLALRAGGRGFAFVTTIVVLLGPGIAQAGATAWSESLYLFLLTLGLVSAYDLIHRPAPSSTPIPTAVGAGLLLGLAADTRYMGIALLPVVAVLLWTTGARRRVLAAWGAGALLPVALWLTHNLATFGSPLGPALPAGSRSLVSVLGDVASALRWEFLPHALAHIPWLAFPALLGVAAAVAWALQARGPARWAAWIALTQLACVAFAVWRSGINDPQGRYTLVAWPFLGLVVCAAAQAATARLFAEPRARRIAQVSVSGLALLVVGTGLGRFVGTTVAPPAQAVARRHAQVAFLQLLPRGSAPVLTDTGHLLRLTTGRPAVQVPPARFRLRDFTAEDARRWRERGVVYAIFRSDRRGTLGPYLETRLGGGADGWPAEDSSSVFVRYRLRP
jgi:4-amino-4-deoxy-L-arabinose transferase-like glycosyltransferase